MPSRVVLLPRAKRPLASISSLGPTRRSGGVDGAINGILNVITEHLGNSGQHPESFFAKDRGEAPMLQLARPGVRLRAGYVPLEMFAGREQQRDHQPVPHSRGDHLLDDAVGIGEMLQYCQENR